MTKDSLVYLIDNLFVQAGVLFESDENVTDIEQAFDELATVIASDLDPETDTADDLDDEKLASFTLADATGFPFEFDKDNVFRMCDLDNDGNVTVFELRSFFWDLYEVQYSVRSNDEDCIRSTPLSVASASSTGRVMSFSTSSGVDPW